MGRKKEYPLATITVEIFANRDEVSIVDFDKVSMARIERAFESVNEEYQKLRLSAIHHVKVQAQQQSLELENSDG